MRWHPDLIKFAVMAHRTSPLLYRTLRDMGVLRLPGETQRKIIGNTTFIFSLNITNDTLRI